MHSNIKTFVVVAIISMLISACQATGGSETTSANAGDSGLRQLSKDEVIELISDKSIRWKPGGGDVGGAYYAPDWTLDTYWNGKRSQTGTWSVKDDGQMCIHYPNWPDDCDTFFERDDGQIMFQPALPK